VLSANLDEEADCHQIISRAARFTLFVDTLLAQSEQISGGFCIYKPLHT